MSSSTIAPSTSSPPLLYWCYNCTQFVTFLSTNDLGIYCSHCGNEFIEQIQSNAQVESPYRIINLLGNNVALNSHRGRRNSNRFPNLRFCRTHPNVGDRFSYNPIVVLRGAIIEGRSTYELYYDDGTGSGLRPVPTSISEFLMISGFQLLLNHLDQNEISSFGRIGNPPASKVVVEMLPTVEIDQKIVLSESNCAICKEPFEIGFGAREMPCKHIYHSDCILPWLAIRNSCPVCRHELPRDQQEGENVEETSPIEEIVGLTIWRLPGGGFAVGRFRGRMRVSERNSPGVLTEMDEGFNGGRGGGRSGVPRRVSWITRTNRGRGNSGGLRRIVRGFLSLLRFRSSSSSSNMRGESVSFGSFNRSSSTRSSSSLGAHMRRRGRGIDLEAETNVDR
ncbi:unnamed protein product [Linum trigynum]|uniref:RING-type E3 ubiquitin transferase n=1 Tax=Linum trigynum TaxID=586398 RepID=A0AAV2FUF1_9ROSI